MAMPQEANCSGMPSAVLRLATRWSHEPTPPPPPPPPSAAVEPSSSYGLEKLWIRVVAIGFGLGLLGFAIDFVGPSQEERGARASEKRMRLQLEAVILTKSALPVDSKSALLFFRSSDRVWTTNYFAVVNR